MSKAAHSIRPGLEEALAYVEGTADVRRYGATIPSDRDPKAVDKAPGAGLNSPLATLLSPLSASISRQS